MARRLAVRPEVFPIRGAFKISRETRTQQPVVLVEIFDGDHVGRGECVPYKRYGESMDGVVQEIAGLGEAIAKGLDRAGLEARLKPGAARNGLDCALWDLEAKRAGKRVWQLLGKPAPKPVVTAFTISLDNPEKMKADAAAAADRPLLKVKLGGEGDDARVRAVRDGAPKSRLIVDPNEAWTIELFARYAPELARLGVEMIEQPLPADRDQALASVPHPVVVCADESCHDRHHLAELKGRYEAINVKLDKAGGLTEAMALADAARAAGFEVMVGCMLATSLAMAPAVLVAQTARWADLDGPLLLAKDREPGLQFEGSKILPPAPELWG
ncbi:MAG: dipeptide epimerase [Alphaproteobacteria bacterium]|nr:dipeptide epimerase [Alphaproteobacteria bacterium]